MNVFKNISVQQRKNIAQQLLVPKHIFWNKDKKTFEFRGDATTSFSQFCAEIPSQFKHLKILATKLQSSLAHLESYQEVIKIADFLENMLGLIAEFHPKDDLEQQLLKQKLHRAFIYTAGRIIRDKSELELPKLARPLNSHMVKVFINEVYLKQQLLGFWFKTLRNRELLESDDSIMRDFLAFEQKKRQLEVVRCSGFIYAITPTIEYGSNPFTIRRFLLEDRLFGGQLLLNGAVLNTAYLQGTEVREQADKIFKKQIDRMITIEGNIRKVIIDLMEQLETYHEDNLISLLFMPFNDTNTNLETEVANRLKQYEQRLIFGILRPLAEGLKKLPNSAEEFDYIYVSIRQLFGRILAAFKDFQTLPALLMNKQAEVLFSRLVAFATFLEKRRGDVFVELDSVQWVENTKKTKIFPKYVREITLEYWDIYQIRRTQVERQRSIVEKPETWIQKLLKTKQKQEERLKELELQMRKVLYEAHQKLFDLPDEIKAQTVHMEFDTLLIAEHAVRSYAFPNGDNGISLLPQTFVIPENRLNFDLEAFAQQVGVLSIADEEEAKLLEAEKVLLKRV